MTDELLATLASTRTTPPSRQGPHLWPLIILATVLLTIAVSLLGETPVPGQTPTPSGSDVPREARIYTITYKNGVFSPTNLRIHAGDTVRWRNEDLLPIRVVAQLQPGQRTPVFDSLGPVQPNSFFSYTFAVAGVFGYHNPQSPEESGVIIARE